MSAIDRARALLNLAPLRVDLAAIEEWNAANERARVEYADHPFVSSCRGGPTGEAHVCRWNLAKSTLRAARAAQRRANGSDVGQDATRDANGAQRGAGETRVKESGK